MAEILRKGWCIRMGKGYGKEHRKKLKNKAKKVTGSVILGFITPASDVEPEAKIILRIPRNVSHGKRTREEIVKYLISSMEILGLAFIEPRGFFPTWDNSETIYSGLWYSSGVNLNKSLFFLSSLSEEEKRIIIANPGLLARVVVEHLRDKPFFRDRPVEDPSVEEDSVDGTPEYYDTAVVAFTTPASDAQPEAKILVYIPQDIYGDISDPDEIRKLITSSKEILYQAEIKYEEYYAATSAWSHNMPYDYNCEDFYFCLENDLANLESLDLLAEEILDEIIAHPENFARLVMDDLLRIAKKEGIVFDEQL